MEARQDCLEKRPRAIVIERGLLAFAIAVELEELREQREDKCEGNLDLEFPVRIVGACMKQSWERTRSSNSETAITRRTFFLATGSRPAMAFGVRMRR